MSLSNKENYLRTVKMTNPERMPFSIDLCGLTWRILQKDLEDVVLKHPKIWPGFKRGDVDWNNLSYHPMEDPDYGDFTDNWNYR